MKKICCIVLSLVLTLALCSCGSKNLSIENNENSSQIEKQEEKVETVVNTGEKIVTDNMEILINSVEITFDVLPDDTSGFYTHYEADSGNVYISVDADVTNKAKQNLPCDEIGLIEADYNDGYKYSGFAIVKDSSTGFTYANITSISPLETKGIKWLIECPQQVDETDAPLFLTLKVDGNKFLYNIR